MVIVYPPLVKVLRGPNMKLFLGRLADVSIASFSLKERERCDSTPTANTTHVTCGSVGFGAPLISVFW